MPHGHGPQHAFLQAEQHRLDPGPHGLGREHEQVAAGEEQFTVLPVVAQRGPQQFQQQVAVDVAVAGADVLGVGAVGERSSWSGLAGGGLRRCDSAAVVNALQGSTAVPASAGTAGGVRLVTRTVSTLWPPLDAAPRRLTATAPPFVTRPEQVPSCVSSSGSSRSD